MKKLGDEWRESHMNMEFNMNLDGEPKDTAPYFLRKLEAGLYLEICGGGKDPKDIFHEHRKHYLSPFLYVHVL